MIRLIYPLNRLAIFLFEFRRVMNSKKIADCLSSLDALITAQADKLDALKAHKKRADAAALSRPGGMT